MKIKVSCCLKLSAPLVELMSEMGVDPDGFLRDRLVESVEAIEEKIANELQMLSPYLISDLSLEVIEG